MVLSRERFQSRRKIHRVADYSRIKAFVRLVRADVADNRFAVIDYYAEREWSNPFSAPLFVQLDHYLSHSECSPHRGLGILFRAVTADVSPNRHDCVADKFIEGAAVIENHRNH